MVDFCDRVIAYSAGHDLRALLADRMRYDAVLRNLELLGEAASRVPADIRNRAAALPWRQVIGTRNRLAHAYLGIDAETIWMIIDRNVPALRDQLLVMLAHRD